MPGERALVMVVSIIALACCSRSNPFDAGVNVRCVHGGGELVSCAPYGVEVWCGTKQCGEGEICCQTSLSCVVEALHQTACPLPPDAGPGACSSNADCGESGQCAAENCGGPGVCRDIDNCGFCLPEGAPECAVCGCNGVSYSSPQNACAGGERTALNGACGETARVNARKDVIACGRDSQCPDSMSCCPTTGECFLRDEPWRCGEPSESLLNCRLDAECGFDYSYPIRCLSELGCNAPGRCLHIGSPDLCGGEVNKVCGCDGVTYLNPCRAFQGGASIASSGPCP